MIQRLEEYLGLQADGTHDLAPKWDEDEQDDVDPDIFPDETPPSFTPFKDLCKRRFLWYYDSYLLSIAGAEKEVTEGQPFAMMPFETGGNTMEGKFLYPELRQRLARIREMLVKETDRWAAEGLAAKKREAGIAANLQRQYEQIVESYSRDSSVTLDLEQVDKNPFVWQLTYFGRPMTNLDGGLFKIKIHFSVRFPEEQPRVLCLTPLFHHRISKDGVLCYFPIKPEEIKSHIEAIIEALEEENPAYDPRTMVHPEAAKLLWGSEEDKKMYNRRLRRAVQRSME